MIRYFWRQSYKNNLCLHFARQNGQERKKPERKSRNKSEQNTKNQKTKIWDERNISQLKVFLPEQSLLMFGKL